MREAGKDPMKRAVRPAALPRRGKQGRIDQRNSKEIYEADANQKIMYDDLESEAAPKSRQLQRSTRRGR